jgi:hypothetical protein
MKKERHKFSFPNMLEHFRQRGRQHHDVFPTKKRKIFMQIESYTQSTATVKVMRIVTIKSQEAGDHKEKCTAPPSLGLARDLPLFSLLFYCPARHFWADGLCRVQNIRRNRRI